MPKRIVSDGAEHAAHVLFDTLVHCELMDGCIHVVGRSKNYERAGVMTLDYARQIHVALGRCLAEAGDTGPPIDGLKLDVQGEHIRFTLLRDGEPVSTGLVTVDVGNKALKWLEEFKDGPNVQRIRRKG